MSIAHHLFLDTLRRTQFMPPQQLAAYADGLLESIARFARENVPFYRDRLDAAFPRGKFDRNRWSDVPLLTRLEAVEAGAAIHAPDDGAPGSDFITGRTSGTTGDRFHFRLSTIAVVASDCISERSFEANNVDRRGHLAVIRAMDPGSEGAYPIGVRSRGWNLTFRTSRRSELTHDAHAGLQAEWLLRRKPRYLNAYPSVTKALADILAGDRRLDIDAVLSMGETMPPDWRQSIETAFACRVIDNYASTEVGAIAPQCPKGGHHVAAECVLVELLDEHGRAVGPGETGLVAVTSYYNRAQPLIRYVLGDYAVWADGPCGCGCRLPRLERVLGRQRGLFRFPDGTRKFPHVSFDTVLEYAAARRAQIVQVEPGRLEVWRVPRDGAEPDLPALQRLFRQQMHSSLTVGIVTVSELPRTASGKMEIYVSRVS